MRKYEKLRKKQRTKILTTLSLLTMMSVSLLSCNKTEIYSIRQNANELNMSNAPESVISAESSTNNVQSMINLTNADSTREAINIEPMVALGSTFGVALKIDRNSMDMGKQYVWATWKWKGRKCK